MSQAAQSSSVPPDTAPNAIFVVGGGVLGLVTASRLNEAGFTVSLVESGAELGGLTATQTLATESGELVCDRFYHVILESDRRVLALLKSLGLQDQVRWTSAEATIVKDGVSYPATSLLDMARLPALTTTDRARVALSVGLSLVMPGNAARRITSQRWLTLAAGKSAATNFWDPLLRAKLGDAAGSVSAAFIVSTFRRLIIARLRGSGDRFGVLPQGYRPVFEGFRGRLEKAGVRILTGSAVTSVAHSNGVVTIHLEDGTALWADAAVLTVPGPIIRQIAPDLETSLPETVPYLGVVCTALTMKKAPNDSYITYLVNDVGLTGVIGMHALMAEHVTQNAALVYLPRYCEPTDPWFDEPDDVVIERTLDAARAALPTVDWDHYDAEVSRARHVVPLPVPQMAEPPSVITRMPGVYILSATQNTTGTLNVEGSLALAERGLTAILANLGPASANTRRQEES